MIYHLMQQWSIMLQLVYNIIYYLRCIIIITNSPIKMLINYKMLITIIMHSTMLLVSFRLFIYKVNLQCPHSYYFWLFTIQNLLKGQLVFMNCKDCKNVELICKQLWVESLDFESRQMENFFKNSLLLLYTQKKKM